jgi:hypothetical protein
MRVIVNRRERIWLIRTALILVLAGSLPYLIAWAATPAEAHFTGLVFNPIDGHSYLAKMRQGFEGSWRFRLAFTPERSPGAHIFLFHLWLGHLARWTGLSLIAVYHGARIVGGIAMLTGIYALASCLSDQRHKRGTMFLLTALGSGLGWLMSMVGVRTADLWVAEAFPVYSLMANAHFPVAIGLMAAVAYCGLHLLAMEGETEAGESKAWPWGLAMALGAVSLGAIQPFGLVPVFGSLGTVIAIRTISNRLAGRSIPYRAATWIIAAATAALPYPVYMQGAIRSDPLLAAWNAQNVTASPPVWDWALSYGLVLILGAWGSRVAIRRGSNGDLLLLGWTLVTFAGMYVPLPLQRRLSIGLGVPLGLLAGIGWQRKARDLIRARRRHLARGLIIAFSALSPIFLVLAASFAAMGPGASTADSWLYLSDGEWAALRWLHDQEKAHPEGVVLCAPQTGAFVPAWSGHPVVYGHPFETLKAERRAEQVRVYWSGEMSAAEKASFLEENRVQYVLVGPREKALGVDKWQDAEPGDLVFEAGDTQIYAVDGG